MYYPELSYAILDGPCYNIELTDMLKIKGSRKLLSLEQKSIQENIEYFIKIRTSINRCCCLMLASINEEKLIIYDIIDKYIPFPKGFALHKLFDNINMVRSLYYKYHQVLPQWFIEKYNKK